MENKLIAGNFEDKYHTKNIISRFLVNNFLNNFKELLSIVNKEGKIKSICEVGMGEGEILKIVYQQFPKSKLWATDLSKNEISKAKTNLKGIKVEYSVQNAQNLSLYQDKQFDLVITCEVLEHIRNYSKVLAELRRISKKFIIVSVPREPVWRILNIARGKYLSDWGNTPGHLNHWGRNSFRKILAEAKLVPIVEKYPFPWQMKLILVL